jgi:hypothetical protein
MKTNDLHLSGLLRGNRPASPLPPRFQENVWRRIEDAEAPVKSGSWIDALAALILRPRLAFAAVAVLLLAGVFFGTHEGKQTARHEAQMRYLASVAPSTSH